MKFQDRMFEFARVAGMSVAYKDHSRLMKFLAAVMVFNPRFMEYITVLFGRVYFPSRKWVDTNPQSAAEVLAHEYVHHFDDEASPVGFKLGYLFPQVLAVIPLLAMIVGTAVLSPWLLLAGVPFVGMAVVGYLKEGRIFSIAGVYGYLGATVATAFGAHWILGAVGLLLMLLSLAPWPAPYRVASEQRGYMMTLALTYWTRDDLPEEIPPQLLEQFCGWGYLRMSWSPAAIRRWYSQTRLLVMRPEQLARVPGGLPYAQVWSIVRDDFVRSVVLSAP